MAQADVAKGIEHALIRKHTARQRELIADVIASVGTWERFLSFSHWPDVQIRSKYESPALPRKSADRSATGGTDATPCRGFGACTRNPIEAPCPRRRMAAGFILEPSPIGDKRHESSGQSSGCRDRAGRHGGSGRKASVEHGLEVLTSLHERSAATIARATAAGLTAASDDEIAGADFILSILPPGDALPLAQRFAPALAASNSKPIYVDCNAVSPPTVERIAARCTDGCPFVDPASSARRHGRIMGTDLLWPPAADAAPICRARPIRSRRACARWSAERPPRH